MLPHSINQISHALGADPLIIQGGGGNISFKDPNSNSFWIKASGKWLEHANTENVYLSLTFRKVKNGLALESMIFRLTGKKPQIQAPH